MNFRWEKKGRIYTPEVEHAFVKSHAQIPTPLFLESENKIRIYIATRPYDNLSQTTFIDVDADNPSKVLYVHNHPVVELGEDGMFDEHGIMPNVVLRNGKDVYLYYIGWSRRDSIPYSNWAGLAISADDGLTFKKYSKAPILDRNPDDLLSAATTSILIEDGIWHLWYVSGLDWIKVDGKYEHTYSIRHAHSKDGIDWCRETDVLIAQKHPMEAITRATVIKLGDSYHMWYCYRGSSDFRDGAESYRIGYAMSTDLKTWQRDDGRCGIECSEGDGWDSKMLAYPYVIKVKDKILMFYNGNYFGKEGFGFAELKITN